jgi:hypothetical protein
LMTTERLVLSYRVTTASSSEEFDEFVLSWIRNILSSRLPSKNAMMHLNITLRHAVFVPFPPAYSHMTWWRNSPRSEMLTFSRKGSATGSCNKQNNNVSVQYYTENPLKRSRCSHSNKQQLLLLRLFTTVFTLLTQPTQLKMFTGPHCLHQQSFWRRQQ